MKGVGYVYSGRNSKPILVSCFDSDEDRVSSPISLHNYTISTIAGIEGEGEGGKISDREVNSKRWNTQKRGAGGNVAVHRDGLTDRVTGLPCQKYGFRLSL